MMPGALVEFTTHKKGPEIKSISKEELEQKMSDTMNGAKDNKT